MLTILFYNEHPKCKWGFVRNKKTKLFADSFPCEATTVLLLSENCTGADLSGIVCVQMATHIKSVEGSKHL